MTSQNEPYSLESDEDAAALFEEHKASDPFPDIPPALLNSADIYDYARTTGMICPFDSTKLKSASYEASVGKDCIYWDEQGKRRTIDLSKKGSFVLKPNSIAFVTTRERFRLPDYMAVRFNLTITNVHRGLLLGTGPLVDPGFEGYILIPLHNLTTNPYRFVYEKKLIWLEFTKISPNGHWAHNNDSKGFHKGQYVPFPEKKRDKKPEEYLEQPEIRSSIPDAIHKAEKSANRLNWWFATAGVSLIAIFLAVVGLYFDSRYITGDIKEKQGAAAVQLRTMEKQVSIMQAKISALEDVLGTSVGPKPETLDQAETETSQKIEQIMTPASGRRSPIQGGRLTPGSEDADEY